MALAIACAASPCLAQAKQVAGSPGVIGTPARLGPYQFTLTSACFTTRVAHSGDTAIAEKGKKLLILNYTVQNPSKENVDFNWSCVRFTVVSAENANHENAEIVLNPEKMEPINGQLKPAQKIPAMTWVEVPASDPIPKVIASSGEAPVLRYDLKGKVQKFTGLFADANGVNVLDTAAAKLGDKVGLGAFDFTVEKVEESAQAIGEVEPGEGQKLFVITVAFANATKVAQSLNWSVYGLEMKDQNDETIAFKESLLRAVGNAPVEGEAKPGEVVRGRFMFAGAKEAKPSFLTFTWGEGRSVKVSLK
jgi:hypothetical protein